MLFIHRRNRHRCSFATLDYDAIPMVTLNPIADRTLILRLLLTYRIGIDDVGVNVVLTSPLYGKLDSSQSVHNRTDGRKDFMNATAKLSNKTYIQRVKIGAQISCKYSTKLPLKGFTRLHLFEPASLHDMLRAI